MRRALDGTPPITSYHGQPTNMGLFGKHLGYDYGVGVGTPIKAPVDGVIRMQGDSGANSVGLYIELDGGGYYHRFLHLSKINTQVGQTVKEGNVIALSGNTGVTTGAHLHHDTRRPSVWNQSFDNYIDWEAKLKAATQPPVNNWTVTPDCVGKTLYLKPYVERWRVYSTSQQPIIGKEKAFLLPKYYGGLSYKILAVSPFPQTVQIQTTYFGVVNIYVDQDAEIR